MYGWPTTLDKLSSFGWARIVTAQVVLHYVLPYSLARIAFHIVGLPFSWVVAAMVELAFLAYMQAVPLQKMRQSPLVVEPPTKAPEEIWRDSLAKVKLADTMGYSVERFISGWFLGADPAQIRRENLAQWVSHMLYAKAPADLTATEQSAISSMVDLTAEVCGLTPEPGYNPEVHCVHFLLEPMRVLHRSLLIYIMTSFIPRMATKMVFQVVLGLQRKRCKESGLYYWWRAPRCTDEAVPDLLFFHGLCGFTGYLPVIVITLLTSPSRGAVLLELEDVSQCLNFDRWPTRQAVLGAVQSGLAQLASVRGYSRPVVVFGHSLGTCAATAVLEESNADIIGVMLVDPVCMLLELPDVAYGFLYRAPQEFFDWLCLLWCSGEPGISLYFRRRFFWYNNTFSFDLFKGKRAVVCLSEHDQMVPSHAVRAYLERSCKGVDVIWWPSTGHTGFMLDPFSQKQIVQWLQSCKA
mmetsp:Transcript_18022/g.42120  ORF Transcript_18022/g.42120 Transcript_18022/m.42120 type:complete len:466 (+) Transcript_18022:89-1486(+)